MTHSTSTQAGQGRHALLWLVLAGSLIALLLWWWQERRALAAQLLQTEPEVLMRDMALRARAAEMARPVYAAHCAACHGASGKAPAKPGVPSLFDSLWLYSNDLVDLEQTIYYGIRSGHPRARNVTDMPALGRIGQLSADEARDTVQYLLVLSGRAHDAEAAARGRALYFAKGNCFDCHASDAHGISDYGTPALTGGSWLYGGDAKSLYESIYSGRHGKCPAWYGKLSALQIRALAVWLAGGSRQP